MEVRQALRVVRKHWIAVASCALAFAVVALGVTALVPREYTATARGFVSVGSPETRSPNVMTSGSLYILARMPSYASLGSSSQVLDRLRSSLQLQEPVADLRKSLTSTAVVDTAFIEVSVTDASPVVAARIADATIDEVDKSVRDLENGTVTVALSDPATTPDAPSNRRYPVNSALALFAGAVVGVGAALGLDHRRSRPRTAKP